MELLLEWRPPFWYPFSPLPTASPCEVIISGRIHLIHSGLSQVFGKPKFDFGTKWNKSRRRR